MTRHGAYKSRRFSKIPLNLRLQLLEEFRVGISVKQIQQTHAAQFESLGGVSPSTLYTLRATVQPTVVRDGMRASELRGRDVRAIRTGFQAGASTSDISCNLGIPLHLVRDVVFGRIHPELGGYIHPKNPRLADHDIKLLREQYADGDVSPADLARQWGQERATIYRWLVGEVRAGAGGPIATKEGMRRLRRERRERPRPPLQAVSAYNTRRLFEYLTSAPLTPFGPPCPPFSPPTEHTPPLPREEALAAIAALQSQSTQDVEYALQEAARHDDER